MNIQERFAKTGFTPEEKEKLTIRLQQAAEQREQAAGRTAQKRRHVSGRILLGIAAAAVMTAGALAAAFHPSLRDWFDLTAPGAQETLENSIYRLDRSQTQNGWTVTLAECAGDSKLTSIWVDVTAPEEVSLELPEGRFFRMGLQIQQDPLAHTDLAYGLTPMGIDAEGHTLSFKCDISSSVSLLGRSFDFKLGPLEEAGPAFQDLHPDSAAVLAVRDRVWTFKGVTLDFPDQSVLLRPGVELPYMEGTALLTELEITPITVRVRLEGGVCEHFTEEMLDEDQTSSQNVTLQTPEGSVTLFGGLGSDADVQLAAEQLEAWKQALAVSLSLPDGTVLPAVTGLPTGFFYGRDEVSGTAYIDSTLLYSDFYSSFIRVLDPGQLHHATVCGVDIPLQ